eukprot:7114649-Prymnesium_polylepis.1
MATRCRSVCSTSSASVSRRSLCSLVARAANPSSLLQSLSMAGRSPRSLRLTWSRAVSQPE